MKITIKGEEIELKHSFRSLIIYEQIKGEAFAPKTVSDIIIYFYSVVLASKIGIQLTFDEFLTILDENGSDIMNDFSQWMLENDEVSKQFNNEEKKRTVKKQKK